MNTLQSMTTQLTEQVVEALAQNGISSDERPTTHEMVDTHITLPWRFVDRSDLAQLEREIGLNLATLYPSLNIFTCGFSTARGEHVYVSVAV